MLWFFFLPFSLLPENLQRRSELESMIPDSFYLSTTFPSKRLVELEMTVEKCGLSPSCVIVLHEVDDCDFIENIDDMKNNYKKILVNENSNLTKRSNNKGMTSLNS